MKISTLDINAKEWFDKVNGNSYFSADVVINYGMKDSQTIKLPFQYGYGDSYQYEAMNELNKQGLTDKKYLHDLRNDGVIIRTNMQRNCKKRDLNK